MSGNMHAPRGLALYFTGETTFRVIGIPSILQGSCRLSQTGQAYSDKAGHFLDGHQVGGAQFSSPGREGGHGDLFLRTKVLCVSPLRLNSAKTPYQWTSSRSARSRKGPGFASQGPGQQQQLLLADRESASQICSSLRSWAPAMASRRQPGKS